MKGKAHVSITAVGAIVLVVAVVLDAVVWRQALNLQPPRLVNNSHQLSPSALILLCIVAIGAMGLIFLLRKGVSSRLIGLGLAAATGVLFVWFQRFWLFGVFGFGGGRYWVHRAAHTSSDQEARSYLRVVLSATQYGVNIAENAVLAERNPATQRRLFLLLADCAPNQIWREQYLQFANGGRRWQVQKSPAH